MRRMTCFGIDFQNRIRNFRLQQILFGAQKKRFLVAPENQRGRFLKITEDVGGRRDTIMLPAGAFKDFTEALERLIEFEGKL